MSRYSLALLATLLFATPALADVVLNVSATANLYGAGHASPPGPDGNGAGVLPVLVTLSGASPSYLTFSNASGVVHYNSSLSDGPDGAASGLVIEPTYGGLSGYRLDHIRVLSGVFLDNSEPADPAPDTLHVDTLTFAHLAPKLRQLFPIGDGLRGTGSGTAQTFLVPAGATRLFVGYIDSFSGVLPGWYGDNSGSVTITLAEHAGTPAAVSPDATPTMRLAIRGVNPAFGGHVRVSLSLPSADAARLELLDISGRRLVSRDLGAIGAGLHVIDLGSDLRVSPGVYLARIVQNARTASARIVVLD